MPSLKMILISFIVSFIVLPSSADSPWKNINKDSLKGAFKNPSAPSKIMIESKDRPDKESPTLQLTPENSTQVVSQIDGSCLSIQFKTEDTELTEKELLSLIEKCRLQKIKKCRLEKSEANGTCEQQVLTSWGYEPSEALSKKIEKACENRHYLCLKEDSKE